MRWPFISRTAFDVQETYWLHTLDELAAANARADKLLTELLRMKRDGFQALPPKIPPKPSDPETAFLAEQESIVDPLLAELVAEGHTLADARAIKRQALADYKNGGM